MANEQVIKKYEFTGETMEHNGVTLHRIKAVRDICCVQGGFNRTVYAGELGGWIEKESNLSHLNECWVFDDSKVYNDAVVYKDAIVYKNSEIFGHTLVCGRAMVQSAKVYDSAVVEGDATLYDGSQVFGQALVTDSVMVGKNSIVTGDAELRGRIVIHDNGYISKTRHAMCVGPLPLQDNRGEKAHYQYITFYKHESNDIVVVACIPSPKGFLPRVYAVDEFKETINKSIKSDHAREAYEKAIDLATFMIEY